MIPIPDSLRGRFLVVLLGVLVPSLTLFGVLHHDLLKQCLLREVDQTLLNHADDIARLPLPVDGSPLPHFLRDIPLYLNSSPGVQAELFNDRGQRLWASRSLKGQPIPVSSDVRGFATVALRDELRMRVLVQELEMGPGLPPLRLVLGESLAHLDSALDDSKTKSLLPGLLILALTGMVGKLAVGGTVEHLDSLVLTAERIATTDDVTQRVPTDNITEDEIRRAAIAFNRLMEKVEQLLDTSRRLLADTSHELRNPLTVLLADLDLLKRELTSETREEVIDEAQLTVRQMTRLVNDLLMLSRAEAHSEPPQLEQVALHDFVSRTVSRLNGSLEHDDLKVLPLRGNDPLVWVCRQSTLRILTNLLENAAFYGGNNSVEISVETRQNKAIVGVRDHGAGIPEQEQEKVFTRFYRVDPSRNRESGGVGLGLSLAKALARAQGGDISLQSPPGKGCLFEVSFPTTVLSESSQLHALSGADGRC